MWWLPVQVHEKSDLLYGRAVEEKICGGYQFKCMRNQAYYTARKSSGRKECVGYQFKCMRNQTYCMEEQEKKR